MTHPIYYVIEDDTLPVFFDTYDGGTGASITMTGLAVTDIEIFKDGGTTQRSSDAGFTLLDTDGIDFDGITGIHGFSIDLSDNTDAGFYTVGSWFHVIVSSVTVDAQTVNFIACAFRILDATRGMAGTALPDAAADAAGGLPISDAGGLDLDGMNTNVNDIETDTNELQTDDVPGLIAGLNDPTAIAIRTEIDSNSTQLTAIVADTNELQTDDVPGLIAALNDPTAATVADAVWDEASAGHTDAGKAGQQLWTDLDAVLADTNELQTDDVPTSIAALPTAVENRQEIDSNSTQLSAIVADTNELQVDDVPGLIAALNDPTAVAIRTEIDSNSTQLTAIVADTNELQTDWANGGRLDLLIDSIITATVGTIAEITGAADIPTTPTIKQAIMLRYQMDRNAGQSTASERRVMNNAGTEVLDAVMSDDATTFDQGLLGAP